MKTLNWTNVRLGVCIAVMVGTTALEISQQIKSKKGLDWTQLAASVIIVVLCFQVILRPKKTH